MRSSAPLDDDGVWTLSGTVRNGAFDPVDGVEVAIVDGPNSGRSTTTQSDGYYELSSLTAGTLTVRFSKDAYGPHEQVVTLLNHEVLDVTLPSCAVALSPPQVNIAATGGSGSVSVTTSSACSWTAWSDAEFIAINGVDSAVGSGTLAYAVAANTGGSRSGGLHVGSETFTVVQTGGSCAAALSSNTTVGAEGGSGSVTVSVAAGCSWTATSGVPWVTISAGASGTGAGTVTFNVSTNSTGSARIGTLTIAGRAFTITQITGSCGATLSPTSASVGPDEATGSLAVNIAAECTWTATSNASFITITGGSGGMGPGTVSYRAAANSSSASRSGTVTIARQTFTVSQGGNSGCAATLSPSSRSIDQAAATGSVAVTIPAGCTWTASSNASFMSITGGSSGSGNGTVSYSVSELTSGTSGYPNRTGTLTIAQQTFTVTQTAPSCGSSSVTLSPTSASVTGAGGTGTVSVTIPAGCAWQAYAGDFVTITSGSSGTGPGTVSYSVAPNTTGSSRSRSIGIAGQSFLISQSTAGAPNCTASLSPSSRSIDQAATTGSVAVTIPAGCGWSASSNASFMSITGGGSGSGNGTVSYSVSELTSSTSGYPNRTGTLTIAQQTFTVTQTAPSCGSSSVTLSPTRATFTRAGGTGTVNVTIPAGCAWDVLPNISNNWITIHSPGVRVGPSTVTYTVAPNTGAARIHHLNFAGRSFEVYQEGN